MMTVSVGLTSCTPQAKDLEQVEKAPQGDNFDKEGEDLKNGTVRCDVQRTADLTLSSNIVENIENASSKVTSSSDVYSGSSKEDAVVTNQVDTPEVNSVCVNPSKTMKQGRVVSRGRRKSDNKEYNQKSQGGGRNRGRKISKGTRDYENSSSNGGNSGADGNGEDNGSDDDDEDDDADEDDDDDDEDDDDEAEDDDDDEDEEESKNEDEDDDISLNGNEKNGKETKIKQEPSDDQEMFPAGLQGFMTGLDGNIPLANLLEKLPNSVCPGDENNSSTAAPGVPVTLHGIVCHEIGGVLVVNIKWRNKFYCGSLMDCSRHAWASPRFPAMDGGENEMKMGGKGGKGKRRQKNCSVSSAGNVNKEATPLKHKLRGRKRGVSGCPPPKSQGFKGMGKRRSKNIDDDDDGPRPGKRSCTMKTTVSPQPSPTLIECPEPGCDKKYKHINGLRYHQAHAHLEESNQSDERSASTSPSPVEEFKEPDTKPGFKGRTSRVSARARSVSPSLAAALAAINERKNDASSKVSGGKKKEIIEPCLDSTNAKEAKESSSTIPTNEEDSAMEDTSVSFVESSDKCQQACEHEIRKENDNQNNVDQAKHDHIDSKSGFKPVLDEQQIAVKNLEKEQVKDSTNLTTCTTTTAVVLTSEMPDTGKVGIKSEPYQGSQEVWETVDSGFSRANGSGKSHNMEGTISISQVEDMEKALGENSFSGKQSDNQLSIPGMQPVDLRQAVDTGVGLINQLGIEVEDISENEEDIDPGQDSEYTNKDVTSLPCSSIIDHKNSSGISIPRGLPFSSEGYLTQAQKSDVNLDKNFVSSDALRAKPGSSFYFDVKKQNTSTEVKINKEKTGKTLSKCESENSDLWTTSSENLSAQSSVLRNFETKPTALEDKAGKTTNGAISMEALVSKSISRSAVEPPLTNSDAPSMRYKFFECRNYGDDNYDKCIRTSDVDQKGNADSKATLAPIRYPELVRNGANSDAPQNHNDQRDSPSGSRSARTGLNVKLSSVEESHSDGKINNKNLPLPTSNTRTRSPIPEALNRNLNHSDNAGVSMEPHHSTKSPSSITSLTGSSALHSSSSRPGFDSSLQSPSSLSIAGSRVHSSTVDRKTQSSPFQPVIVKHEFQPTETPKGIRQEVTTQGFTQSDSKVPFMSSLSITPGEQSKQNMESKGSYGFNESRGNRKSPLPGQGTEDHEKSYKAAARALSRPHPALISRSGNSLAPSLPVGVAHPYPRASDGGLASNHLKVSEHKTSATVSSVTSVTYSSTSPRPSALDVSAELPQPENKAKQLQTLQVPIPVGEVSPVSLKRSPGPAIHSGLPSVLPIIGPGIKTQGSVSSHPSIRPGIKASGMNEPIRGERKNETSLREPSAYATSKSPVPRPLAMSKPSPEGKSPQQSASGTALYQKARASDDSNRDESEVVIVKEEPLTYSSSKDKTVAEKERERREIRDTSAELSYRTQEPISAEQLRNLQFQQQLTLQQYYQPFMQAGGMSLEMLKSLSQLAYMQGMPVDPKATAQAQLFQNMQPEQQMQLMQLHRQMMLEQEKKGMRNSSSSSGSGGSGGSGGSSSHQEARNFEKKETPKPSDQVQEDRRMDESGIKKSPQGRAHQDDSDFRRFPSRSESLQYTSSRGSIPLSGEPPEKKSRADDSYEREREMERLKYKQEEERLQKQKHVLQISMYKQLENDLQNKQLSGSFPRKRQATPEISERPGSTREEDRVENRAGGARDLIYHRPQESATSTAKATHHSSEAENSQASPHGQAGRSQSLLAPRSPRPSRSPVPTSRYKENSSAADEKRDGSNSLPANFMPATQFQAYLSQLNFDQSTGQLPYMGPQFSLPPGLVMSMPITSHGESSLVTSMASASREREARSPYRSSERDRTSTPTSHSNSQSRTSTSESHERLQRLKDSTEKETRHSPVMYQEERARNRSTASEQNVSPKSSSRASDFKGEENSLRAHPSIISNNLAISRMAGHMDVLTEEEIIRRQRFAAEYSDPSQALRMGYYVAPGLIGQLDPAYAASMMQSPQHIGRGMEHYITKRQ